MTTGETRIIKKIVLRNMYNTSWLQNQHTLTNAYKTMEAL